MSVPFSTFSSTTSSRNYFFFFFSTGDWTQSPCTELHSQHPPPFFFSFSVGSCKVPRLPRLGLNSGWDYRHAPVSPAQFSFGQQDFRFLYIVYISSLFFFEYILLLLYHSLSIHLLRDMWIICSYLPIVNKAIINSFVEAFFWHVFYFFLSKFI